MIKNFKETPENIQTDLHWFASSSTLIAVSLLIQTSAFRIGHRPTGKLGVFYYIQLLWAFLFSYFIWEEGIDGLNLSGSLLIVAAGGFILLRNSRIPNPFEDDPPVNTRDEETKSLRLRDNP